MISCTLITYQRGENLPKKSTIHGREHYPSIDLRLTKSKADTEDTSLRETDSRALIEVSVPLFQGGMTQSRIKEARILQNAAIHDLEHAKKQAKVKLEGYLSDRALSVETLKALQESQLSAKLYLFSETERRFFYLKRDSSLWHGATFSFHLITDYELGRTVFHQAKGSNRTESAKR